MLSVLISGLCQPDVNINVYLRPLIDDFKELWKKRVSGCMMGSGKNISTYVPCSSPLSLIFQDIIACLGRAKEKNTAFIA